MNKKTRNILLAVLAVIVLGVAIWLIAGGAKGPETPAATEAPAVTEAPAEEATEAPAAETAAEKVEEAKEEVKEAAADVKEAAEDVKEATETKVEEAKEEVKEAAADVKEAAEDVKEAAETKVEEAKEEVKEAAADVKEAAEDVKEAAETKVEEAKTAVEEKAEEVKEAAEEKIEEAKEDVKEAAADVKEAAEDVKEAVEEKVEEVKDAAADVKETAEEKAEEVKAAAEEKIEEVKDAAADVKEAAEEKAEEVKAAAEEKVEEVKDAAADAKEAAEEKAEEVKAAAEEKVEEVKDAAADVKEAAEEKAEEVKEAAADVKAGAEEKVAEAKEEVQAVIEEKAEEAKEAAEDVKAAAEETAETAKDAAAEKTEEVKDAAEEKAAEIKAAVEDKVEEVKAAAEEKVEEAKEAVEEKIEEVKAAEEAGDPKEVVEDKAGVLAAIVNEMKAAANAGEAAASAEPQPFTVTANATVSDQAIETFGAMLAGGNAERLGKIKTLADFGNNVEYKLISDGVDTEGFVSYKGENLASALVLRDEDGFIAMTDVIPSYSFKISKKDLTEVAGESVKLDPEKFMEALSAAAFKVAGGLKFKEAEQVEETIFDTVFTTKTAFDMTTKEMALLGLNAAKEFVSNEGIANFLEQLKAKGVNFSAEELDKAIENVNNTPDEEVPEMDAAVYTNEKGDVVVKVVVIGKDGQEMMHSMGGKVNGEGCSEVQMGEQSLIQVKGSKAGVTINAKYNGMEFVITAVPENTANGKIVNGKVTMGGMELLTGKLEYVKEGALTGSFNTEGKTDITVKDIKEKKDTLISDLLKDASVNYKPVLIEKLQKVAPDVVSLFAKVKNLLKQSAPAMIPAPVAQ